MRGPSSPFILSEDLRLEVRSSESGVQISVDGITKELGSEVFSFDVLESLRSEVGRVDLRSYYGIRDLQALGEHLYESLFKGPIGTSYRRAVEEARYNGTGVRLRFMMEADSDALAIPWEVLYDPEFLNDFIAQSESVSIVREVQSPDHVAWRPIRAKGVALIVRSDPTETLRDAEKEVETVDYFCEQAGFDVVRVSDPTPEEFRQRIEEEDPQILHVIAHGRDERWGSQGFEQGLALSDGRGELAWQSSQDIVEAARRSSRLRFIYLSASYTDILASQLAQDTAAVIGMWGTVTDRGNYILASQVYETLLGNLDIDASPDAATVFDTAVRDARRTVSFQDTDSLDWASVVLYQAGDAPFMQQDTEGVDSDDGAFEEAVSEDGPLEAWKQRVATLNAEEMEWYTEGSNPPGSEGHA